MKFEDIITLAKAGYKPSEVKELLNLCTETQTVSEVKEDEGVPVISDEEVKTEEIEEETKEEIDYKKLYEESQENLKKAQKVNTRENMAGEIVNDEDTFADIMRSFM